MTELNLVVDADPRLAKLRAMLREPESDVEALGNCIMTLQAWAMLSNRERAGTPGVDYIMATCGRLTRVRQHLIDRETP